MGPVVVGVGMDEIAFPGWTTFDIRMSEGTAGRLTWPLFVPQSAQATVTCPGFSPPTPLPITNCGCELSCGPRLPSLAPVKLGADVPVPLAIVSPLKVLPPSDDTTSMIRFGLY